MSLGCGTRARYSIDRFSPLIANDVVLPDGRTSGLNPIPPSRSLYAVWLGYAALALMLVVSTILFALRIAPPGSSAVPFIVPGLELATGAICLAASRIGYGGRIGFIVGIGVVSWAFGDIGQALVSLGFHVSHLVVESFHLWFFPVVIAASLALSWHELRRAGTSAWINGIMAALGAAAVSGLVAFQSQVTLGPNLDADMHLALLAAVVTTAAVLAGGFAATSGRQTVTSVVLGLGSALTVCGWLAHRFPLSISQSGLGVHVQAVLVPVGMIVMACSGSLPATPWEVRHRIDVSLPNVAAVAALLITLIDILIPLNRVARMLAMLTIIVAAVRMFRLLRETRAISDFQHGQAATDELTGVWNRRHLFRVLDAYFAGRSSGVGDTSFAILFVDMDHFKEVNDSFGHSAGDHLLKLLAARMAGVLRDRDILGRLGGDEFAVLLPGCDLEAATTVALRLSTCLDHPFQLNGVTANVGASIGIAIAPDNAQDSQSLLQCADLAMYRAKTEKTRLASYVAEIDLERNRMRLVEELHTAIEEDELVLYYQPQLDLRKGTIVGVEALIRWRHPRLGLLAPNAFLPIAEETGEIHAITDWVLERAVSQCAAWRANGNNISVSVNVPSSSLLQRDLVSTVKDVLDRHGLPAASLVVEITENWVMSDLEVARQSMLRLAQMGLVVSIDDFGAGVTSLAYLTNLPVGELKLDRAFVVGLTADDGHERHLMRSTIELGHSVGLRIVAEGVEDGATLDLLAELGCDLVQGYHIGRPTPPNELALQRNKIWGRAA